MSTAGPSRSTGSTPFAAVVRGQDPGRDVAYYEVTAQTNLDDINDLQSNIWNEHEDDTQSDGELAFRLAAEESIRFAARQRDHDLAVRLSLYGDELDIFAEAALLEQASSSVSSSATRVRADTTMAGQRVAAATIHTTRQQTGGSARSIVTASAVQSPSTQSQKQRNRLPTGHNCVICTDPIYGDEIRAPCGDHYDKECILDLIQAATRDESLFPPRCCRQVIPLESVIRFMSIDLIRLFHEKKKEFGTLKRVYCANPSCSRFLGEQIDGKIRHWLWPSYICDCATRTCTRCKARYSPLSHRCSAAQQDSDVLALGQTAGWQRCPGCEQLIELHHGCFHMTCRCKTEFCYVCRAKWKSCACPQWDERRLLAAAEARADAQLGWRAPAPAAPAPPARVQAQPPRPAVVPAPPPRPAALPVRALRGPVAAPIPHATPPATSTQPLRPAVRTNIRAEAAPGLLGGLVLPASGASNRLEGASGDTASSQLRADRTTQLLTPGSGFGRTTLRGAPQTDNTLRQNISQPQRQSSNGQASRPKSSSSSSLSSPRPLSLNYTAHVGTTRDAPSRSRQLPGSTTARENLVRQWMERLRVDHDCQHNNWKYRRGGGSCEVCHHKLPLYLFRCTGCEMLACNRCRKNRL